MALQTTTQIDPRRRMTQDEWRMLQDSAPVPTVALPGQATVQSDGAAGGQGLPTWVDREEAPDVFMNELMRQDNPYMELARTQGLQQANQRGLLSSSMAVGAAQDAAIRATLPIAQQRGAQNTQRNLSNQQFGYDQTLQGENIANQQLMQQRDIASAERVAQMQIAAQQAIASQQISAQMAMSRAQIAAQQSTANMQIQAQLNIATMNNDLQRQLAAMNLGARENELAVATLADNARTYENSRANILQNTQMSATARQDALDAINAREATSNQAALSLFNIELNFASTSTASTSEPTTTAQTTTAPTTTTTTFGGDAGSFGNDWR
jgi:hypothetical protein